ncbi:MAG: hypothetical protein K9K67_03890 [Bacteriovoracaceae bacterium]|nr:hypothetical protein [Bacteriovoracaceae bacterium]
MTSNLNELNYDLFDNVKIKYNSEEYAFDKWVFKYIKQKFPEVDDLKNIHKYVPKSENSNLTKFLIEKTQDKDFQNMMNSLLDEVFLPRLGGNEFAIQKFQNIRIFRPDDPTMKLPFHTGQLQGHGLGERTMWVPFNDAMNSSSMYIADLESSRKVIKKIKEEQLNYNEIQELSLTICRPANITMGEAVIFSQEHLHGNVANETNLTRVSMDFRILIRGTDFYRKTPGGYFRLRKESQN